MTPLQHLRLRLGLSVEPTAEEIAVEEARYSSLRAATPREQLALRLRRLRAAGWDAQAHDNDPRRLAGAVGGGNGPPATLPPETQSEPPAVPVERRRGPGPPTPA